MLPGWAGNFSMLCLCTSWSTLHIASPCGALPSSVLLSRRVRCLLLTGPFLFTHPLLPQLEELIASLDTFTCTLNRRIGTRFRWDHTERLVSIGSPCVQASSHGLQKCVDLHTTAWCLAIDLAICYTELYRIIQLHCILLGRKTRGRVSSPLVLCV